METVIIVIHLMVIIALVALVLMQRSEGGALGIGGGGGNNFMTTRGQGNVLTRSTAILGTLFFATSLAMGILAQFHQQPGAILDSVPAASQPATPSGTAPAAGGTILDQLQNRPATAPQLPSSDGTTLPGSPATPAAPEVPTTQ